MQQPEEIDLHEQENIDLYRQLNRYGRRNFLKKSRMIKQWKEVQRAYPATKKPMDLGINQFKRVARQSMVNPNKLIANYKLKIHEEYKKFLTKREESASIEENPTNAH